MRNWLLATGWGFLGAFIFLCLGEIEYGYFYRWILWATYYLYDHAGLSFGFWIWLHLVIILASMFVGALSFMRLFYMGELWGRRPKKTPG